MGEPRRERTTFTVQVPPGRVAALRRGLRALARKWETTMGDALWRALSRVFKEERDD